MIKLTNLTKAYDTNRGVFDLNIHIKKGEVIGFLGPNGAGKTTTMKLLMGFIIQDSGYVQINNYDCFNDASIIQKDLGYLPGEISFSHDCSALEFLLYIAKLKKLKDLTLMYELITYFDLDTSLKTNKMSKGTKQKLAIILCFMHNPSTYLLDEPTSGLDPIMQHKFINYILEEKKKGKTIFISSHLFEEIEKTCDRVILLKDGKIKYDDNVYHLKNKNGNKFIITFTNKQQLDEFIINKDVLVNDLSVTLHCKSVDLLIKELSKYTVVNIKSVEYQLEDFFLNNYKGDI